MPTSTFSPPSPQSECAAAGEPILPAFSSLSPPVSSFSGGPRMSADTHLFMSTERSGAGVERPPQLAGCHRWSRPSSPLLTRSPVRGLHHMAVTLQLAPLAVRLG